MNGLLVDVGGKLEELDVGAKLLFKINFVINYNLLRMDAGDPFTCLFRSFCRVCSGFITQRGRSSRTD